MPTESPSVNPVTGIIRRIQSTFRVHELSVGGVSTRQRDRWIKKDDDPSPRSAREVGLDLGHQLKSIGKERVKQEVCGFIREVDPSAKPETWEDLDWGRWFYNQAELALKKKSITGENRSAVTESGDGAHVLQETDEDIRGSIVASGTIPNDIATGIGAWLEALRTRVLDACVRFKPEHVQRDKVRDYCLPVRVVREDDIQRAEAGRSRPSGGESEYLTSTHEEFARAEGSFHLPRFPFNRFIDSLHEHIILRGEPNIGKSTAECLYLAERSDRLLEDLKMDPSAFMRPDFQLPLMFPLKNYRPGDDVVHCAVDYVFQTVMRQGDVSIPTLRKCVDAKVAKGEFFLVLDGLDELPVGLHGQLRSQLRCLAGTRVLLSTRLNADDRDILVNPIRLRMVCFWPRDVEEFLRRYFPHSPDGQAASARIQAALRLSPAVRALAQIPLLLAMLCYQQARHPTDPVPMTRGDLLRNGLLALLKRGDERRGKALLACRDEAKLRFLAAIAWQAYERGPLLLKPDALAAILYQARSNWPELGNVQADELLGELLEDGVIVLHRGAFSFSLRSFHELCVAEHLATKVLAEAANRGSLGQLVRSSSEQWPHDPPWNGFRPLNQPGWRYIWPLVAGRLSPHDQIIDVLLEEAKSDDDTSFSRTLLFAHALGEFLNGSTTSAGLSQTGEETLAWIQAALINLLGSEELQSQELEPFAAAFAQLQTATGAEELAARLLDENRPDWERCNYAYALGEFTCVVAMEALTGILDQPATKGSKLPAYCAAALGHVGTPEAKEAVLRRLQSKERTDYWVDLGCLSALERMGAEEYGELLRKIMRDPKRHLDLRAHAISLAAKLDPKQCEAQILAVFAEPNAKTPADAAQLKSICIQAFGELGTPAARDKLIAIVKDPSTSDDDVGEAVASLGQIGDTPSVAILEALTTLRSPVVRLKARIALASPVVRLKARIALARLGRESDRTILREGLHRPTLPRHLLEKITTILIAGNAPADEAALVKLLREGGNPEARICAARALGHFNSTNAHRALAEIALETNVQEQVRWECALAGTAAGEPRCLTVLLTMIASGPEDKARIRKAAEALARNGSAKAREWLETLLERPPEVRKAVRANVRDFQRRTGWRLGQRGWESP